MRIGCLQFAPQVGDVSNNLTRADAVLAKAGSKNLENLDLLVLPEMAFSGYNFKSFEHISPYLEPTGSGISSLWARTTALKYDCTVAVGYPERVHASGGRLSAPEHYNSLIVVNGEGETVANYRKSFLYYTDDTWANEGQGFYGGKMGKLGQVAMGICMDINPYKFEAPWHAYEFAFHVLEVRANLVILSMAWLTNEDRATFTSFPQDPDLSTLTYWVRRLEPVIRAESSEEIIVVIANRCGIEDDATYAGTSAVIGIKDGEVSVYGLLGRGVKELLVVDTEKPPFAKLVDRPEPPADEDSKPYPAEPPEYPETERREPRSGSESQSANSQPSPGIRPAPSSSTRKHSQPAPGASKSATSHTRAVTTNQTLPLARRAARPRPKLSILTDHETVDPFPAVSAPAVMSPTSFLFTSKVPTPSLSSAPPDTASPDWAIPIFVEPYTPEDPPWPAEYAAAPAVASDSPRSPWSRRSPRAPAPLRPAAPDRAARDRDKRVTISVAASPSVFQTSFSASELPAPMRAWAT